MPHFFVSFAFSDRPLGCMRRENAARTSLQLLSRMVERALRAFHLHAIHNFTHNLMPIIFS